MGNKHGGKTRNKGDLAKGVALEKSEMDIFKEFVGDLPLMDRFKDENQKEKFMNKICNTMQKVTFKQGDVIYSENSKADKMYILLEGRVELSQNGEVIQSLEDEGDFFGEDISVITRVNTVKVQNEADAEKQICTVLSIDSQLFRDIKKGGSSLSPNQRGRTRIRTNMDALLRSKIQKPNIEKLRTKAVGTFKTLRDKIDRIELFVDLAETHKKEIVQKLHREEFKKGQKVISLNEIGDKFYIVEKGHFRRTFEDEDGNSVPEDYINGGTFGEVNVLHPEPSEEEVECVADGVLWTLSAATWHQVAHKVGNQNKVHLRSRVDVLKNLPIAEKIKQLDNAEAGLEMKFEVIANQLHEETYKRGDKIVKEGEFGDKFYIIKKGSAKWYKSNGESGEYAGSGFFGELALLGEEKQVKRAATIEATDDLICYVLHREQFQKFMMPYQEVFDKMEYLNPDWVDDYKYGLKDLEDIGYLGKGAYGFVTARKDPDKKYWALKAIPKQELNNDPEEQKVVLREQRIMKKMRHPRIVNLVKTFHDECRLYFLTDVCECGQLFELMRQKKHFTEGAAKFYSACVILAFEYLHGKGIIYRDLKPENLVLTRKGYIKITDFGFAKQVGDHRTRTFCGTPEYFSPEIVSHHLKHTGYYGCCVDWWCVGILIHELICGKTPFKSKDRKAMYSNIRNCRYAMPRSFSPEAKSITKGFLTIPWHERLGINRGKSNATFIKKHAWFRDFSWPDLIKETMEAPNLEFLHVRVKPRRQDKRPAGKCKLEIDKYF